VAWPAAFLRRAGFDPAVLDLSTERLDQQRVREAAFVGICVPMHTALVMGTHAAQRVREVHPDATVCFYGLYAGLNATYLLDTTADFVISGEYEQPLVSLVQALQAGTSVDLPGVSRYGHVAHPHLARTEFPAPHRESLGSLETYAGVERSDGAVVTGYVEASRGCKHHCLHCPIPPAYGGRFFAVSRDVVLQDITEQVERQGARHITFGDPDFLNGPTHARRVVRELHERYPHVTFDFTTKVEHILRHRELLPEMAANGCLFIISAVESLSGRVLENLNKGHTRTDIEEALRLTRDAGIALRPTFMPFTPWSTLDDYVELLRFILHEGLIHHVDPVQFAIRLLVPPGSALLGTPQFEPYRGELDQAAFSYTWRHPDPRMDALHERVSAIVEEAAENEEPDERTFARILREALAVADTPHLADAWLAAAPVSPPAPRLTEPWFC